MEASLKQHLTATLEQQMKEIRTQLNQLNQEEPGKKACSNHNIDTLLIRSFHEV